METQLEVWAPRTPGATATVVGQCGTLREARQLASAYTDRRDLRMQDVVVRREGRVIARCGPCR